MKIQTLLFLLIAQIAFAQNKPFGISFKANKNSVDVYDFIEITLKIKNEVTYNPFTDVKITGVFKHVLGDSLIVQGFCDSKDGKVSKIRFMPRQKGEYTYTISYKHDDKEEVFNGKFNARSSKRKGLVTIDKEYPWHFQWEGTGEHYFYYGTTAYWMLGWKDDRIIRQSLDRLANHKVNRIRVAINGRQDDGKRWSEPLVKESKRFTFMLSPWEAKRPDDLDKPEFDVKRFNVSHWQKMEKLLDHARDKNMVISVVFYVDGLDHGCDPFKKANMGNEDEKQYYTYAAARFAAYSNVMWDITNEYHLFRSEDWAEKMGNFMKTQDPYNHLMSIHGHGDFPFRKSKWVDFTMFQNWDECANNAKMLEYRKAQEATGIIKPQVNEEYGYEGHYPAWGCGTKKVAPGRAAENRTDLAWQMYMAGCYQTTGERADEGTGAGNDEGGGWINGRGNDKMVLFKHYGIIYNTFTSLEWWKMDPHNELVNEGNLCLAEPGQQYLVYTQTPQLKLQLQKGNYKASLINPRSGEEYPLTDVKDNYWIYPVNIKEYSGLEGKWVFKLIKK